MQVIDCWPVTLVKSLIQRDALLILFSTSENSTNFFVRRIEWFTDLHVSVC